MVKNKGQVKQEFLGSFPARWSERLFEQPGVGYEIACMPTDMHIKHGHVSEFASDWQGGCPDDMDKCEMVEDPERPGDEQDCGCDLFKHGAIPRAFNDPNPTPMCVSYVEKGGTIPDSVFDEVEAAYERDDALSEAFLARQIKNVVFLNGNSAEELKALAEFLARQNQQLGGMEGTPSSANEAFYEEVGTLIGIAPENVAGFICDKRPCTSGGLFTEDELEALIAFSALVTEGGGELDICTLPDPTICPAGEVPVSFLIEIVDGSLDDEEAATRVALLLPQVTDSNVPLEAILGFLSRYGEELFELFDTFVDLSDIGVQRAEQAIQRSLTSLAVCTPRTPGYNHLHGEGFQNYGCDHASFACADYGL